MSAEVVSPRCTETIVAPGLTTHTESPATPYSTPVGDFTTRRVPSGAAACAYTPAGTSRKGRSAIATLKARIRNLRSRTRHLQETLERLCRWWCIFMGSYLDDRHRWEGEMTGHSRFFWLLSTRVLLTCGLFATLACSTATSAGRRTGSAPKLLTGYYRWGFEQSAFLPCGDSASTERWWVILPAAAQRVQDSLVAIAPPRDTSDISSEFWFAELEGAVGQPKPVGHLGFYDRVLRVTRIRSLRRATSRDCGGTTRALQLVAPGLKRER